MNEDLQKKSRIIYIKIHPRDPKKIRELLFNGLKEYISKLKVACKLIITEDNMIFEEIK